MKVSEVMRKEPVIVSPETTVLELARLMEEKEIGSIIVVENGKPVGIVTERDMVRRVLANNRDPEKLKAIDVASKPVIAITVHGEVEDAVDTMRDYKIRRIVVVDNQDTIAGILTTDDLGYNLRSLSEDVAIKYITLIQRRGVT
jgi:CBS domain-containing protein